MYVKCNQLNSTFIPAIGFQRFVKVFNSDELLAVDSIWVFCIHTVCCTLLARQRYNYHQTTLPASKVQNGLYLYID